MSYWKKLRRRQHRLIAMSTQDCLSDNLPYDRSGLTALMIKKARDASNLIDCDTSATMSTMGQSFLIVILWGAMTAADECKGRLNRLAPHNNQNFMLLFARCNDNRTAQCKDQWRKYPEVEYIEYAKDIVYVAKGEYGKHAKGDCIRQGGPPRASCQRRHQRTPCQGWRVAEYDNEPFTTRAIDHVRHTKRQWASCHKDMYILPGKDKPHKGPIRHARQRQALIMPAMKLVWLQPPLQ